MTGDPELDRLRQRYPLGSRVRTGPYLIDKGVHEVIGHGRMPRPFHAAVLILRTPQGDTARDLPDNWRHAT